MIAAFEVTNLGLGTGEQEARLAKVAQEAQRLEVLGEVLDAITESSHLLGEGAITLDLGEVSPIEKGRDFIAEDGVLGGLGADSAAEPRGEGFGSVTAT